MIAALALTALMMQVPARDARPAPAAGTATVSGVVISADVQARPLRRARVTISGGALAPGRTAITADDGSFAFTGLGAGRYILAAIKNGYVATSAAGRAGPPATRVTVADGETQTVSVRLPRGAVITGVVLDADGQPAWGITVSALLHRFVGNQGERRYLPAGISLSDDRGVFRIYGLPDGEYVVAAQSQIPSRGFPGSELRTVSRGALSDKGLVLAQVFHPSATEVGRATRVTVRAGEERSGVDVQLQYVPVATVGGVVSARPGWEHVAVTMVRAEEGAFEPVRSAHTGADGRFTLSGVPPGRYRVVATSRSASRPGTPVTMAPDTLGVASVELAVDGEDIANLALSLEPGLTISGRVVFQGERPGPALPSFRVSVPAGTTMANAGFPSVNVEGSTFRVDGLLPGVYRTFGTPQGIRAPIGPWWLKSLVVNGREVLDAPLDLRQSVDDAVATFADSASELSGVVRDAQGRAATDIIVVFSTDRATWFFNSRRVVGLRTDAQGRYTIRNLPPGEYRIVAGADLEQGEWFDPAVLERLLLTATAITITGAEKKTHDVTIR